MCVLTDTHGRPVCADGHPQTSCVVLSPRTNVLSPRTNVLICVLMDSHRRPMCADGHRRTHTDTHVQPQTSCVCWPTPTDVLCVLTRQPTWAKITRTVHGKVQRAESKDQLHGKGQRAESKDQRANMCTDGQPRTSCVCRRTHTDSHGRPVYADGHKQMCSRWDKITQTVHGKGQRAESKDQRSDIVLSSRTNVLICVLMDSHGRPVCADGHTRTHKVSHGRPVCAGGHPRTSSTDVLCVLADTHGRPVCTEQIAHDQRADMCTDGQPRTSLTHTDVLCVLTDTHGRPVQPTRAKITRTVHRKGQRAESKDQRADIQPTWAKITQTVHGKGQRAESKDQRADMYTDGQPRTSCRQTTPDVLCVLADTHGRPVSTEQTAHLGQNHPNSPQEGPAC
ncbi:unnamed protein product [Brassica rapa]|uniref:Uncharacterized protein n=1 Tax=Brassica campestris TaxID=3711 RepID=A0A8D9G0I7_BRACM|nr:unnamed protein product [Brassica rapa]